MQNLPERRRGPQRQKPVSPEKVGDGVEPADVGVPPRGSPVGVGQGGGMGSSVLHQSRLQAPYTSCKGKGAGHLQEKGALRTMGMQILTAA